MSGRLRVTLGQHSSAGNKAENQDFHGALVPEGETLATKGVAVAIADGISTSQFGAAAAETAVKSFLGDYYCTSEAWSVRTSGERVVAATNSWLHAQNGRPLDDAERERGMICTLSALVLRSRRAHIFHVGDARIARVVDSRLESLTSPHRVWLGGGESFLGRALGANRSVQIDYQSVPLQAGDMFVLTTDGVHEHLRDDQLVGLLAAVPDLDAAARAVAEAALTGGSDDNLTVQLVRVDEVPTGDIGDLLGTDDPLVAPPPLKPGDEFSGYAILRTLHSGSRNHVFLARPAREAGLVALKVPATEHAADPARLQELLLEEWVMRRLDHPNLLRSVPSPAPRRHVFCVSQYIEGRTLAQWMRDRPQRGLEEVRGVLRQLGAGLQALHRREMIHRDLRPENVLVDADMTVRIIDFGSVAVAGLEDIAPPPGEAAFAGTMQYSAPELYLGHAATRLSDIYSLGVIAYQLLAGDLPYGPRVAAATTAAAQRRLRYVPASERNPEVPDWMDAAVARAVAIDPAKRYQELSEFLFDLAHPNRALTMVAQRPLIQRAPVQVWQTLCAVLAVALLLALLTR